jgi:hypothetical protein
VRAPLALIVALVLAAAACSKKAPAAAARKSVPIVGDCENTKGSVACPPDSTDPSGKKLPSQGGPCRLPTCKPCGSGATLAFRDAAGHAQAGWCRCIPKSDDSGEATYSCTAAADWNPGSR